MQQANGCNDSAGSAIRPRRLHHQTVSGWATRVLLSVVLTVSALASAEENDLFAAALGDAPQLVALDDVLGKAPKTVFVPGRFYRNGQGALFINGQRFAVANGGQDVAGFLTGNGKYLVALRANVFDFTEQAGSPSAPTQASKPLFTEEELRKLPVEMRVKALQAMESAASRESVSVKIGNGKPNATVFYRCSSATACTIARVVKGVPDLHITDRAIWFNQPSQNQRIGRDFVSAVLTYSGIDLSGTSIDGPAGVLYAAPLPKGEWLGEGIQQFNRLLLGDPLTGGE